MVMECEYCYKAATVQVNAQWTIVDFDYILACDDHVPSAYRQLGRRLVDGHPVQDMWHTWLGQR